MEFRTAPEVEWVARDLIEEHHEDLDDNGPRIEYVMFKAGPKPGGRMFRIRKISGIHAFLAAAELPHRYGEAFQAQPFVVMEISDFWWHTLDEDQRKGMVDHVLSHLVYDDEKAAWRIEPPEFGEFPEVFERHGFWRPNRSFRAFAKRVSEQLSLLPDEPEEPEKSEDEEPEQENLDISITHNGRTVETNTKAMQQLSERLAGGRSDTVIVNGKVVDKETGEVLQESHA